MKKNPLHTTICDRCGDNPPVIMSKFNTQMCCDGCIDRERNHPMYPQAAAAELAALRGGDYNFPGIGLPADLWKSR